MQTQRILFISFLLFSRVSSFGQSYINDQIAAPQTANAWINGVFRTNNAFESWSAPSSGGFLLHNNQGGLRWVIRVDNPEAGDNTGYDFSLVRRNDAGSYLGVPFTISRQTGKITMAGVVSMGNASSVSNTFRIIGTGSDLANTGGVGFYENDNITRRGFIGDAYNTNGDMYMVSDQGGIALVPNNGVVALACTASNTIVYNPNGVGGPTFNSRSAGTKAVWYPAIGATATDYAIGVESQHQWFSTSQNTSAYGFKWYGGVVQVARLSGDGTFHTMKGFTTSGNGAEGLRTINDGGFISFWNSGNTVRSGYLNINSGATARLLVAVNQGLVFGTNNADRMTITAAGNVGIGSGTPASRLGVYGVSDGEGAITIQSATNSRFWIQQGGNLLRIGGVTSGEGVINITNMGQVGIGTYAPGAYKLAVEGTVGVRKIKVTQQTNWADFVFQENYKLQTLAELEEYIRINKRLPDMPSEKEVQRDGVDLGEMNVKLLQKLEELTLHIIEMNKRNNELERRLAEVEQRK